MPEDLSAAVGAGFLILSTVGLGAPARLQGDRILRWDPDADAEARSAAVYAILKGAEQPTA